MSTAEKGRGGGLFSGGYSIISVACIDLNACCCYEQAEYFHNFQLERFTKYYCLTGAREGSQKLMLHDIGADISSWILCVCDFCRIDYGNH